MIDDILHFGVVPKEVRLGVREVAVREGSVWIGELAVMLEGDGLIPSGTLRAGGVVTIIREELDGEVG